MTGIPERTTSLLVENKASMENWDAFIESASLAIERDLKNEAKAYKLKLAFEELISNIIKAAATNKDSREISLKVSSGISSNDTEKVFTLQNKLSNKKKFLGNLDRLLLNIDDLSENDLKNSLTKLLKIR